MIYIQKQIWRSHTRYLVFDTGGGSVQLNLYSKKQEWGGTAFIYTLWVNEEKRRKGIARRLLETVEKIAKDAGHEAVTLEWELVDSPYWVFDWYVRRGYDEREFDNKRTYAKMVKEL